MKVDTTTAPALPRPVAAPQVEIHPGSIRSQPFIPVDEFRPGPGLPGGAADALYQFGLSRKGSEDLEAEAAKQQARADEALQQSPPDLKTYFDARKKLNAIEGERTDRAMAQRGYELGLRFKDDAGLEKEFSRASAELERVMSDPLASEADRERARARVQAVVAELERRD